MTTDPRPSFTTWLETYIGNNPINFVTSVVIGKKRLTADQVLTMLKEDAPHIRRSFRTWVLDAMIDNNDPSPLLTALGRYIKLLQKRAHKRS